MIKIIHSSILFKWANLQNQIIIAPTVFVEPHILRGYEAMTARHSCVNTFFGHFSI